MFKPTIASAMVEKISNKDWTAGKKTSLKEYTVPVLFFSTLNASSKTLLARKHENCCVKASRDLGPNILRMKTISRAA
jgi:hypothetical protein